MSPFRSPEVQAVVGDATIAELSLRLLQYFAVHTAHVLRSSVMVPFSLIGCSGGDSAKDRLRIDPTMQDNAVSQAPSP
jgi:hypothetical protein